MAVYVVPSRDLSQSPPRINDNLTRGTLTFAPVGPSATLCAILFKEQDSENEVRFKSHWTRSMGFVPICHTDQCRHPDGSRMVVQLSWHSPSGDPLRPLITYNVENPTAAEPAVVTFQGPCHEFRERNLISADLLAEQVGEAVVFLEGSALRRHKLERASYGDALILAEAYELLLSASIRSGFGVCIGSAEAAKAINAFIANDGGLGKASAWTAPSKGSERDRFRRAGEPAVWLGCSLAGKRVELEECISPNHNLEKGVNLVVKGLTCWLTNVRSVVG
jgi:hypothetical protein